MANNESLYRHTLSREEQDIVSMVRNFAKEEIYPQRERLRQKGYPWDIFEKMKEVGLTGALVPREHGGLGLSFLCFAMITEAISWADGGVGLGIGATQTLVGIPLAAFGNEEQKRRWLPGMAAGEILGAYAQTAPEAGSDIASIKTRGEIRGDEIILNGAKTFITNGSVANVVLALVRTGEDRHLGLTMVLVDADEAKAKGTLKVSRDFDKKGLHCSPTSELVFEDCRVPISNILGQEDAGLLIARATLDTSRHMVAAQACGIGRAAFELALEQVTTREQFGKKIAEFQATQAKIADMEAMLEAARLLTYQAAWLVDQYGIAKYSRYEKAASIAKLFASETAVEVAKIAAELHGGMGYMAETPIKWVRDSADVTTVYEGTSDIQRYVIARKVLKQYGVNIELF